MPSDQTPPRAADKQDPLVGATFISPDTGCSFRVEAVHPHALPYFAEPVATLVRCEFVAVSRLLKDWRRDGEMDALFSPNKAGVGRDASERTTPPDGSGFLKSKGE